jgi:hypothetical protein
MQQLDSTFGELLIDSLLVGSIAESTGRTLIEELSILAPNLVMCTRTLLQAVVSMRSSVDLIAARRSLQLFGEVGEVVEFDPLQHRLDVPADLGARTVRIVRPGVRTIAAGISYPRIICKVVVQRV